MDAEKPAHLDYHLCVVEANARVGFQARVGVDAIVAGPRGNLVLDAVGAGLGTASNLNPREPAAPTTPTTASAPALPCSGRDCT